MSTIAAVDTKYGAVPTVPRIACRASVATAAASVDLADNALSY
jgi:hypothetical protein